VADELKDLEYVKTGFWPKIKETIGKVPFALDAVAMYYCLIDSKTPLWVKGVVLAALAYFINPFDAIPDAIPVVGFVDDLGAIAAALTAVGQAVTAEHKEQARKWAQGANYQPPLDQKPSA
jgi:uncharacterized membrane protein YkvA (DUF1232 family)